MFDLLNTTPDGGILIQQPDTISDGNYFLIVFFAGLIALFGFIASGILSDEIKSMEGDRLKKYKFVFKTVFSATIVTVLIFAGTIIHWNVNAGMDKMLELNSANIKEWADDRYGLVLGDKAIESMISDEAITTVDGDWIKFDQAQDDGTYIVFHDNKNDDEQQKYEEIPLKQK